MNQTSMDLVAAKRDADTDTLPIDLATPRRQGMGWKLWGLAVVGALILGGNVGLLLWAGWSL